MMRRAAKLVLTSYVLLNVHYVPPLVENLARQYFPEHLQPFSVLSAVSYGFLSWASFTQPLSYLVRTKQLPKIRCCCDSGSKAKDSGLEQSGDPHG